MTGRRRHERASAFGRTRALVAHLVWWSGVAAALLCALGALGVALRADPERLPWSGIIPVAQALSIGDLGSLVSVAGQASATTVEVGVHAFWAVLWCAVGLVVALMIRPSGPADIPNFSEMDHTI